MNPVVNTALGSVLLLDFGAREYVEFCTFKANVRIQVLKS
jgi:hypothetical protein